MPEIPSNDNIAVLRDVYKTYQMGEVEIHALREVDLEIRRGEFIAILGPSGSGKTTLLNILGGIDTPSRGSIVIDGQDISGFNRKQLTILRREKIGFIFQFFNLIPTLTARENVEYALELEARQGVKPKRDAATLLDMVGLKERLDHFPFQLSGGEQQRVAVARAIAKEPALILGDEPTGNLDYRMGKLVLKTLKEVNVAEGTTCIIVTHNMPIAQIADRIIHIHDGEVAEIETIENPVSPEDVSW